MGMYTEIFLNVELKNDTPLEVVEDLRLLFDENFEKEDFNDAFFKENRQSCIGRMSSYYFRPKAVSTMWWDHISESWHIVSLSNLKNYAGEIEAFFEFLQPYIDAPEGEFIGYHRYEENDSPVLMYKK